MGSLWIKPFKILGGEWQRHWLSVEKEPSDWENVFFGAMADFRFLPAGRIISGAGSERDVTLFNCFVMGDISDDMAGIFGGLRGSGFNYATRWRDWLRFLLHPAKGSPSERCRC